jgi:phage repressor protein C with HTH and peptisase S24 domain
VDSFQIEADELNDRIVIVTSEQGGLSVSHLRRYEGLTLLESESHKSPSIVLDKESGLRILGRVLWWISAAP